jgi:phosphoglycolate phosphatase-like HAD superfamily hydrolase
MFSLTPRHDYLVAIDSDGCVFDSMEVKHKECFIPNFINFFELQGISKFAREAAEFVNLYSKSRGANRFIALVEQLDWLRRRPEVKARGVAVHHPLGVLKWMAQEKTLGNPALEKAVAATGDLDLKRTLAWSLAVNKSIAEMVRGVPPFPNVRDCLDRFSERADMIVCSQTPNAAVEAEWQEHGISPYVQAICGQEVGSKKEILAAAKDKYPVGNVLMIGDAPGDQNAALANGALFFPVNPGHEEASWKRLVQEGMERFFTGTFAGVYQKQLIDEFDRYLPALPPWPVDN